MQNMTRWTQHTQKKHCAENEMPRKEKQKKTAKRKRSQQKLLQILCNKLSVSGGEQSKTAANKKQQHQHPHTHQES